MHLLAAAVAAAFTVAIAGEPPVASSNPGPRWLGVALGTAAVRYRQHLGDPLLVTRLTNPPERKARYLLSRAPMVFLILTEREGTVTGIETVADPAPAAPVLGVEADPSGMRLGTPIAEVAAARPNFRRYTDAEGGLHLRGDVDDTRSYVADYRFSHDRLVADTWLISPIVALPPLPGALPLAEAAGEGESSAILDVQTTETAGIDWEHLYLRYHTCDGSLPWRGGMQAVQQANGRSYDIITATCPSSGAKRTFVFDITAFFGKV